MRVMAIEFNIKKDGNLRRRKKYKSEKEDGIKEKCKRKSAKENKKIY